MAPTSTPAAQLASPGLRAAQGVGATLHTAAILQAGDQPRPQDALDARRSAEHSSAVSASPAGTDFSIAMACLLAVPMAVLFASFLLWMLWAE